MKPVIQEAVTVMALTQHFPPILWCTIPIHVTNRSIVKKNASRINSAKKHSVNKPHHGSSHVPLGTERELQASVTWETTTLTHGSSRIQLNSQEPSSKQQTNRRSYTNKTKVGLNLTKNAQKSKKMRIKSQSHLHEREQHNHEVYEEICSQKN